MLTSLRPDVPDGCISDLTFDAWRAGELEVGRVRELERHLADCGRCRQRHESLDRQASRFLAKAPSLTAREPSRREVAPQTVSMSPQRRRRRWLASSAVALSAAAALALLLRPTRGPREITEDVLVKGQSHVSFHVQHGGSVQPGTEGQVVFPGDQLRFSVTTTKPAHVAILSLDGAGVASVYFPTGNTSRRFGAVSSLPLDSSVMLDDTLGQERLWALFCERAFALEPLRSSLGRERTLHAPPGCTVEEHTLSKQRAP
jgi:hypothetical protein